MKVIFTGGGSGGHVIPNIAIIGKLKELMKDQNLELVYIGSKTGIEKELIEGLGIPYREIATGKLRRYLSMQNVKDFFNVFKGISQARKIIKEEKPDVVFSKGGFVSVPVVFGAKKNHVPIIIHESDMTPGLANKLAMPKADKVCVTFPETLDMVSKEKGILTGSPVRAEILKGNKEKGLSNLGFDNSKKVILVIGGSLGSVALNTAVKENLDVLLKDYQIVNICGKGKMDESINREGFRQFEYIGEGLEDVFAASDIVISRAGAGSIYELLALEKPNILIPLSKKASRGDQILNANSFTKQGFSLMLEEEDVNEKTLLEKIKELESKENEFKEKMKATKLKDAAGEIAKLIASYEK